MKGVLIYNLQDFDDTQAHKRAVKALDMVKALKSIEESVRHYNLYEADKEFTIEEFKDILDMHRIDLNELLI